MVAVRRNIGSQPLRAAVRDYFTLLQAELRGRRWCPTEQPGGSGNYLFGDHDDHAEVWYGQISTILIGHGLPYLTHASPRPGTNPALSQHVRTYLYNHPGLLELMQHDVFRRVDRVPPVEDHEQVVVAPPSAGGIPIVSEEERAEPLTGVDFLAREQRNQSLVAAGQQFVLAFEAARLRANGCDAYADGIEHVMMTGGDGPGYAIHSYGLDGSDRFIDVKTTCYGHEIPFYLSAHEVAISRRHGKRFWLYRVFAFRREPRLYMLQGPLDTALELEPTEYRCAPR